MYPGKKSFICGSTNSNPPEKGSDDFISFHRILLNSTLFPTLLGQKLVPLQQPRFPPRNAPWLTQHLLCESNPLCKHKLPFSSLNWKELLYFRIEKSPCIKREIPAIYSNRVISPSLSHWISGKDSSHDLINFSIISIHALQVNLICIFP